MFSRRKKFYKFNIMLIILVFLSIVAYPVIKNSTDENPENLEYAKEVNLAVEKTLVLVTHYVAGQETTETRIEEVGSTEELKSRFEGWNIVEEAADRIVLERHVEALSPTLKDGAYFSLGADGHLTLYRGNQEDDKKVIRTFFRIDIEKLESVLPKGPVEQLYEGIPIQDLAEYNSVLSTFSEYSLD